MSVKALQSAYQLSVSTYEKAVTRLTIMQRALTIRKTKLSAARATASEALNRWKVLAQKRAAKEAVRIQFEAGKRARTEWEAVRIQNIAIAKAKGLAEKARKAALATKTTRFIKQNELVVRIGGLVKQFKTIEAKMLWMANYRKSSVCSGVREEDLIAQKISWKVQKDVVKSYLEKAKVQSISSGTTCSFKT